MRFVVVVRQPHARIRPHRNRRNSGRLRHLGCHGNRFPMSLQIDRMARRVPVPQLRPEQRAFFDGRRSADAFSDISASVKNAYMQYVNAYPQNNDNEVLINIWNWNSDWTLSVVDENRKTLPYTEVWAYDPLPYRGALGQAVQQRGTQVDPVVHHRQVHALLQGEGGRCGHRPCDHRQGRIRKRVDRKHAAAESVLHGCLPTQVIFATYPTTIIIY